MPDLGERFKALGDLGRYELFLEVYRAEDGEASLRGLLAGDDPLLKMTLLPFLDETPEPRAVRLIISLLQDPNEVVREAAGRAYLKSQFAHKHKLLRPVILSSNNWASSFAIKTLSESRDARILPLLLALLAKRRPAVQRAILKAMRFMPDPRAVPALAEFAAAADEETRYQALKTLAVLPWQGTKVRAGVFFKAAKDSSPRVRKLALAALSRYSSRRIAVFLQERAFGGSSDDRLEAIAALSAFPREEWVRPLVALLTGEQRSPLRLTAEIALKRFPSSLQRRALTPLLDDPEPPVRHQAALLLAELFGSAPEVRARLLSLWKEVRGVPAKLAWLDVLRELGGADVFPLVYEVLAAQEAPVLAYAGAAVLNRVGLPGGDLRLLSLLRDPALNKPVRQVLLSGIVKRGPDPVTRGEYLPLFLGGLEDPVANVRYLSLRALSWYPHRDYFLPVMRLLSAEKDAAIQRMAQRLLLKGLGSNPMPVVAALHELPASEALLGHVVSLLKSQAWTSAAAGQAMRALAAEPLSLLARRPEDYLSLAVRLLELGTLAFEQLWLLLPESGHPRFLELVREACRDESRRMPPLPVAFLAGRLAGADRGSRRALYALLGANRRPEGLPHLASSLLKEKDEELLKKGREELARLLRETGP